MNMRHLLNKLSAERQQQFIRNPVWQAAAQRGLSWREAAEDMLSVQAAVLQLSEHAVTVLKEMLRLFAAAPVEGEKLLDDIRKTTFLSGAECQLGLNELEEAGILFSVRKVWGESLYFIPADCFRLWQQALMPFEPEPLSDSDRQHLMQGTMRPNSRPFGRQLLSAMAALAGSGLELTAKGALPKKTITKLVQAAELDEKWLVPFGLNWPLRECYPIKAAFLLEACSAMGLLEKAEGTLKWNEPSLSRWLKLKEAERERQLLNWCLTLLLPAGASSAHIGAVLIGAEEGEWFSGREVRAWQEAASIAIAPSESTDRDEAVHLWYGLLHGLGWFELVDCMHNDTRELFARRKISQSIQHETSGEGMNIRYINVQPNGEIMAAPECPFTLRWELELLAERISDEQVTVYRLEASTVARALENGRTRQSIRRTLELASGGEALPAAAEALLEVWTSRACRSEFAEIVLLRCDNAQMAEFIENHPDIAPFMLEKLGTADFIVEKSHITEIRRLLQQAGYPPRKGIQTYGSSVEPRYPAFDWTKDPDKEAAGPPQMEEERITNTAISFVYDPFPLQHFELTEHAGKENIRLFSQLEHVPAMWTKQLRAYHHSTRKELIEQALAWQTPVQLRMSSELRAFVPERLEQSGDAWAVIGLLRDERELIRLTPDMWEEMRLVIPGRAEPI